MNIVIVYGTNSGGTYETALLIKEAFEHKGHHVKVIRADTVKPENLSAYDLIIFGSCTWELVTPQRKFEGTLQEHFLVFRNTLKGKEFPGKRFAVFALGDSSYTTFCIAANHLVALVKQFKGIQIGETLRINKFFFNLGENRKIVRAWSAHLMAMLPVKK